MEFETTVSGKWVLTGEHAVIRGGRAVAIPHDLKAHSLTLRFSGSFGKDELEVAPRSLTSIVAEMIGSFEKHANIPVRDFLRGNVEINSTIPLGSGFGSSAALCVAITRWLCRAAKVSPGGEIEVATRLEDYFHATSSGMDVAACFFGQPIEFSRGSPARMLGLTRLPRFTFHDTGLRAMTRDCVGKVGSLVEEQSERAIEIDSQMDLATEKALSGLQLFDAGNSAAGLVAIAEAMALARECFYRWSLVPEKVAQLEEKLLKDGALGVKLTGAGLGGFVVALWP